MNVEFGMDYLLSHFERQFPRTISTLGTEHKQVEVYDRKEALHYFKESNHVDCRISAFGRYEIEREKPNLIFVDLDNKLVLHEVLTLFHKTLNAVPLVLSTGNGYAIIQPIQIEPLQNITLDGRQVFDVPKKFLSFAERYLTNSKCDLGNHPSLKSCLIRVPYSYNSKKMKKSLDKTKSQVTIISEWNRKRPTVNHLPFQKHLRELEQKTTCHNRQRYKNKDKIKYIERLLDAKPTQGRKRIFALVICPYLVNVKKLSSEECEKIITDYFDGYIPRQLIRYKIRDIQKKGILPYSLKNMQENDSELYHIISHLSDDKRG